MDVILIANDLVPGAHLPVAAPGLRQWGIAHGLRAHGLDAELVVPRHVADRMWGDLPSPVPEGATVMSAAEIPALVASRAPSTVILTNSNQYDLVADLPDTRYVFDFFAPKVLELVCQEHPEPERLATLRDQKVRALAGADAVIVNGAKKTPYVLAWLLQTDRDVTTMPLMQVPMGVPVTPTDPPRADTPLKVGIAGYLQAWSQPGPWLDVIREAVEDGRIELHLLLPPHWGGGTQVEQSESLRRLAQNDHVVRHDPKTFESFVDFLGDLDLVLDLFDWSLEREYAMVTRTVVAISAGRPVVHPPFTEVAPSIADAEAGWLVDVAAPDLAARIDAILADPAEVRRRAANARELAATHFAPEVGVRPLVEQIREWSA